MDINLIPKLSLGAKIFSSISWGLAVEPRSKGTEGPYTSQSIKPILRGVDNVSPNRDREQARLTARVDLPTPPFPLAMAMILSMPEILFSSDLVGSEASFFTVMLTSVSTISSY
jgi:hypothetical protein